jgi:chaperonin GroEL
MAVSKEISFGNEAREKIKIGIDKVADAVKTTLGPKGRTVIFRRNWGAPVVTKDGVTVAKEIVLPDFFEDTGAQLCKQVAMKTNDVAGDGTTTATVLAQAIVERGAELIAAGANPVAVKRGIDAATAAAIEYIKSNSTVITLDDKEMVKYIASISGNDSEIGEQVANAFIDVGENGVVTFQEGKSISTTVEMMEGFQFDRGYASPYLCTDQQKMRVELENVKVLLWEKPITNAVDLAPLLEQAAVAKTPIAIIADDIGGDAIGTLVINVMRGVIKAVAVKAPGFGERRKGLMQDMALMTGGTFFDESLGYKLDKVRLDQLGTVQRIVVNSDSCVLVGGVGAKDKVEAHIESLKNFIAESDSKYDIEKYQERIANLSSGV